MNIWIDTDSGTWGPADSLVFLDIDTEQEDFLLNASDSEIIAFGKENGV